MVWPNIFCCDYNPNYVRNDQRIPTSHQCGSPCRKEINFFFSTGKILSFLLRSIAVVYFSYPYQLIWKNHKIGYWHLYLHVQLLTYRKRLINTINKDYPMRFCRITTKSPLFHYFFRYRHKLPLHIQINC